MNVPPGQARPPRRWTIFDLPPSERPFVPDADRQPQPVVARTTPNVRAPGIRAAGEKHPQDGDSHRRLIAKTVATPEDFNAGIIDRYLLAVAAHELELYAEAITLLDAALSAGLGDEYASRAERLRAICAVKAGI